VGAVQQAVNEKVKIGRREREVKGLGMHSSTQLYMRDRRQCDGPLPEKKMPFCFNHMRNPDAGLRRQKVWEFKIF
jgi:hypothetical protein